MELLHSQYVKCVRLFGHVSENLIGNVVRLTENGFRMLLSFLECIFLQEFRMLRYCFGFYSSYILEADCTIVSIGDVRFCRFSTNPRWKQRKFRKQKSFIHIFFNIQHFKVSKIILYNQYESWRWINLNIYCRKLIRLS